MSHIGRSRQIHGKPRTDDISGRTRSIYSINLAAMRFHDLP
jgi:hypothetical protein